MATSSRRSLLVYFILAVLAGHVYSRGLDEDAPLLELDLISVETISTEVDVSQQTSCNICLKFTNQVITLLADPKTTDQAVSAVQAAICSSFKLGAESCDSLVAEYVPQFIVLLQEYVTVDRTCVRTKICSSELAALPVPEATETVLEESAAAIQASPKCQICLQVAYQVLLLLEDGKTQEEILATLHKACQRVKNPKISGQCDSLVDVYFPQLIVLLKSVTPEEFCQIAKYCSAKDKLVNDVISEIIKEQEAALVDARAQHVGNAQDCMACRFAIAQAKKRLKDPETQVKITVYLTEACSKVPDVQEQCKAAILEYLPLLFAGIDTYIDPAKLCAKANLCPAPKSFLAQSYELPSIM